MKLTSATVNVICKNYQKKYQKLLKIFSKKTSFLSFKEWAILNKSFFMSNWICLYWFFIENQNSKRTIKKISYQTFSLLNNDKFVEILAVLFKNVLKICNYSKSFFTSKNISETFQTELKNLLAYVDSTQKYLKQNLVEFIKKNTQYLATFSIYDYCINEMKFIFEYPDDQKYIYEKNVTLLQKQISVLSILQENIQKISDFHAKNDACILITTMRKKIITK